MIPPHVVTKEPVELMEHANVMQGKLEMIVVMVSQFTTEIKSRYDCTLVTAMRKLESRQFSTSSSFVKI